MSMTCPPTIPLTPVESASSRTTSRTRSQLPSWCTVMRVSASPKKASPASIAIASPNFLWAVGLPRLKSSSSIAGRSSWIKEYVWMSSMAAAEGNTSSGCTSNTHATSMHSVGRTRLPPASMEYRMASSRTARRGSSVKRKPRRYSSKVRRCCSQRSWLRVPLASLAMTHLAVGLPLRTSQDPAHERRGLLAGEPLGELHSLVDGDVGGYVLNEEHLAERQPQNRAVHRAHPMYGPPDRNL